MANCIGLTGDISIVRDLLGFFRGRVPPDPTGAAAKISLLRQGELLEGQHFHLNVIAIGSDNFTDNDDIEIDYSIYKIRNIYQQRGIGVGRVKHYGVLSADAGGLDAPTTESQLEEITDTWTVPNNGIDVFIPFNMNVSSNDGSILGLSAVDGPCEEKNDKGMNGSVAGLWGIYDADGNLIDSDQTARTFAHEVGHYLGLEHNHGDDCPTSASGRANLMAQSRCADSTRNSVVLTSSQGNDVKDHCLARFTC